MMTGARPPLPLGLLLLAAGLGFLGGIVGATTVTKDRGNRGGGPMSPIAAVRPTTRPATVSSTDDPVVDVVARVSPAVVSIIVTKDLPKLEDVLLDPFQDPFFGPSPFRFRLRRPSGEVEERQVGGGTGFVVDDGGLILTNRHVVADESAAYTALFNTGEKVSATVLARDPALDLAVLKVEKRDLPTVPLGNSSDLRVGQRVIAIGNALGEFRNTVSVGIVSGLGRQVVAGNQATGQAEVLESVIQTDAAINPGNSGGPLLNLAGEAIGVNTAVAGGAENIGFAIPSAELIRVLEDIQKHGRIIRSFLGVRYVLVTPAIAKANNLPVDYGALVLRGVEPRALAIAPGSAAETAGIRENDILLELDGQRIDAEHTLAALIRQKRAGERVRLKVLAGGQEKLVEVKLGEAKLRE